MANLIQEPFLSFAKEHRDWINKKIQLLKLEYSSKTDEEISLFISHKLNEYFCIYFSRHSLNQESKKDLVSFLLELFFKNLISSQEDPTYLPIKDLLINFSPDLIKTVKIDLLLQLITNSVFQIKKQAHSRISSWEDKIIKICREANNISALEISIAHLAWMSGLHSYKKVALKNSEKLEESILQILFSSSSSKKDILKAIQLNPLVDFGSDSLNPPLPKIGGFTGLNGVFLRPPILFGYTEEGVYVSDHYECWLLEFDSYSYTLTEVENCIPAGSVKKSILYGNAVLSTSENSHFLEINLLPHHSKHTNAEND